MSTKDGCLPQTHLAAQPGIADGGCRCFGGIERLRALNLVRCGCMIAEQTSLFRRWLCYAVYVPAH